MPPGQFNQQVNFPPRVQQRVAVGEPDAGIPAEPQPAPDDAELEVKEKELADVLHLPMDVPGPVLKPSHRAA